MRTRHELGLEQEGQSQIVAGDWVKFHKPVDEQGLQAASANQLGLRNIAFAVDDIHATVDRLRADSFELVGAIGVYEDTYRLCYVRGPEGIIVSPAERIT